MSVAKIMWRDSVLKATESYWREQIAQEIEANKLVNIFERSSGTVWNNATDSAAKIARGK